MKVNRLCSICARGGSKGFKNKNIKDFFGKPLIAHVIEIAKATQLFDALAVSSDSHEILTLAKESGVDFVIERPQEMATDTAAKLPAIQHCASEVEKLSGLKFNTFVDLSVTSPLMLPSDIIGAVSLLETSTAMNVITGSIASHSPYFSLVEKQTDNYVQLAKIPVKTFERRQDCPPCYDMNGAIYVWKDEFFFELNEIITNRTLVFEMPPERSIDIDTQLDYEIASFIYSKRKNEAVKQNRIKEIEV